MLYVLISEAITFTARDRDTLTWQRRIMFIDNKNSFIVTKIYIFFFKIFRNFKMLAATCSVRNGHTYMQYYNSFDPCFIPILIHRKSVINHIWLRGFFQFFNFFLSFFEHSHWKQNESNKQIGWGTPTIFCYFAKQKCVSEDF